MYPTPFQKRVYDVVSRIPMGSTWTYKEVADEMGVRGGARAVGNALRANRDMIVIPCHRVVRSDKGLGGFSRGVEFKRKLLAWEKKAMGKSGNFPLRKRGIEGDLKS